MIIGITRIRNEEEIIGATLDHIASFVDGVVVFDDASTDKTVEVCQRHRLVREVIRNTHWEPNSQERNIAEGNYRQQAYEAALKYNPDWVYCFDADEYIELEPGIFERGSIGAYTFRLFDFYITPNDVDAHYLNRDWMGPEYRDILMMFRPRLPGQSSLLPSNQEIKFYQRAPRLPASYAVAHGGYVKHYGKAISVKHWDEACEYYINNRGGDAFPLFRKKWLQRVGKAVHTRSDFNNKLIMWEDRFNKGIPLKDNQFLYDYQ